VVDLFQRIQPQQIYAAGDLSDPHGTHRTCLLAIMLAIEEVKQQTWFRECQVWLYRGAWQEFEPHEIQMAVPLTPAQLQHKIAAIFRHQSQKDPAMFPGADPREFWQRARDRNMVSPLPRCCSYAPASHAHHSQQLKDLADICVSARVVTEFGVFYDQTPGLDTYRSIACSTCPRALYTTMCTLE